MGFKHATALFLFLFLISAYLLTVCPDLYWRDSPEMVLVPFNLDIAHSPGIPAFSMLGKLSDLLPFGAAAFRLNLLSVFAAAGAGVVLYYFLFRLISLCFRLPREDRLAGTASATVAASLAFVYCLSEPFWSWSVVAETYSLHILVILILLYLALDPLDPRMRDDPRFRSRIWAAMLILGIGCGIHPNVILFAGIYVVYFFIVCMARGRFREFVGSLFFLGLGLSVYLYLPIRSFGNLYYDHGNPEILRSLLIHVTGRSHSGVIFGTPWALALAHWKAFPLGAAEVLSWVVVVAAIIGMIAMAFRAPGLLALTILLAAANLYLVKDWQKLFGYLPALLVLVIWSSLGFYLLWDRINRAIQSQEFAVPLRSLTVVFALVILLVSFTCAWENYKESSRTGHYLARAHGRGLLESLPEGSVLISAQDHISYLAFYFQLVENLRTDVRHIHRVMLRFPEVLADRHPDLPWPKPASGQEDWSGRALTHLASVRPVFLGLAPDTQRFLPLSRLFPHGMVFQVLPSESHQVTEEDLARQDRIFNRYFRPIVKDERFNLRDWTARGVYAGLYNALGAFYFRRGYSDLSLWHFEKAFEMYPEGTDAYFNLAGIYIVRGDYDKALAILDKGLEVKPLSHALFNNRALALELKGDIRGAIASLEESLRINPNQHRLRLNLARLLWSDRQRDKSEEVVRGLIEEKDVPGEILVEALVWIGSKICLEIETNDADMYLKKAVSIDPASAKAHYALGRCLIRMGDQKGGETEIRKAKELDPDLDELTWKQKTGSD